ncbi:uroporphyrinogen decarboxylase family protein [Parabacteroides sp. FAFU027]|uniref:uroporphyrinogen decarboxylase family protein n=1 Tax=Parabacteroides sp. FAFU027 TaxID=2922715 RepID=UPI001FAF77CE|nr:uroporphyrinogen decarboxylase family protein [Parabacteroides sp. FAFU027]
MRNMKEWANQQIANKKRIAIPIMTHPGIEMIGKRVVDAVQNGEVHAQAVIELGKIYPSAATTVIMDLTVEAEAFGCQIDFPENDMPHIIGRLVSNAEEIDNLKVPDLTAGRIPGYLKANKLTAEAISDKPVFAGIIGPFSLAGRLYDMSEIMIGCYIEPEAIGKLLDKCTEFLINYCQELKRIGSNGVMIAEPAAGLLSNEDCQAFSSVYVKKIVDAVQDDNFMVVLHNCGNKGHCTEAMLNTDAAAFHFGNAIDMLETLNVCPKDKLIMGNVDPVGVMKLTSAAEVKTYVADLLQKTATFDNYVLSTGCDLPPHVPAENIQAFYEALNEYNQ